MIKKLHKCALIAIAFTTPLMVMKIALAQQNETVLGTLSMATGEITLTKQGAQDLSKNKKNKQNAQKDSDYTEVTSEPKSFTKTIVVEKTPPIEIELSEYDNQIIPISGMDINRITLPFAPRVVSSDDVEVKSSGNNVYVNFKSGSVKPTQLYFEDTNGKVISVRLLPAKMPAQIIILKQETKSFPPNQKASEIKAPNGDILIIKENTNSTLVDISLAK